MTHFGSLVTVDVLLVIVIVNAEAGVNVIVIVKDASIVRRSTSGNLSPQLLQV